MRCLLCSGAKQTGRRIHAGLLLALCVLLLPSCKETRTETVLGAFALSWSPSGERLVGTRLAAFSRPDPSSLLGVEFGVDYKAREWNGVWLFDAAGTPIRRVASEIQRGEWLTDDQIVLGPLDPEDPGITGPSGWQIVNLDGTVVREVPFEETRLRDWHVAPDGRCLAYAYDYGGKSGILPGTAVGVYRVEDQTTDVYKLPGGFGCVAWSPDGKHLVGSMEDSVWRVDVDARRLEILEDGLFSCSDDYGLGEGGLIAVADGLGRLRVIDWSSGDVQPIEHAYEFRRPRFSRRGHVFLCVRLVENGANELWAGRRTPAGWQVNRLSVVSVVDDEIALSHDGRRLAGLAEDGTTIRVIELGDLIGKFASGASDTNPDDGSVAHRGRVSGGNQ